jgi:hypothetical protein
MDLERSCEKDVGGIIGTGLYICFSVLTTKHRLGVSQKITSVTNLL